MKKILSSYLIQKLGEDTEGYYPIPKQSEKDTNEIDMTIENMAKEWTDNMQNEDGTTGPHWTLEQTEDVAEQKKIQDKYNKYVWFITMNMIYSDYYKVITKFELDPVKFSACMADAFLGDVDSVPAYEKVTKYYHYIVKK